MIKPSYALGDRATDYVYFENYDDGFGPPKLRTVLLSTFAMYEEESGESNVCGVVSYRIKLFLQKSQLTGHNDCEFTLVSLRD